MHTADLARDQRRGAPGLFVALTLLLGANALAQDSVMEFELGGVARVLDKECIRLTPDQPYVSGSAWFERPIDLSKPFEMRLKMVLGDKDLQGADGIVFVFHPSIRTGLRGEGMGFAGLAPSLGIEFDTYQNLHLDDPLSDHLALMTNGASFHRDPAGVVELGDLEDGKHHPLRIVWSPETSALKVYLDDQLKASFPGGVVRSTFGGAPVVYWGMTAATGRLSNVQDVCIEKLFMGV